jgi:tight adherence protein B
MILLSLTCALLAVWALVPGAAPAALAARLMPEDAPIPRQRRPLWKYAGSAGLTVLCVGAVGSLTGGRGAAIALATGIAVATGWHLATSHARMRAALCARRSVTEACATLAAQVRVGRLPTDALAIAAEDCQILRPAQTAQLLGGDVTAIWHAQSRRRGHGGLAELARAWQISTRIGAPMAAVLERVAESMAAEESVRAVVAGELAGPRATGKIMAFLPLAGLALGYALGGDPIDFLLQSSLGWGCLVGGVGLAAAGVLWVESLAQRAAVEG